MIKIIIFIILAILALGFMIIFHELGHFITAKAFGVKVLEFTIGFGPALLKKKYKDTTYALRLIPLGGAVMMEGEDEESDAEGSFQKASVWQRFIIISAGAFMNILFGLVILLCILLPTKNYVSTEIAGFADETLLSQETGLQAGDIVTGINGYKIFSYNDIKFILSTSKAKLQSFDVLREGKKVSVKNLDMISAESSADKTFGIDFAVKEAHFADKIKLVFTNAIYFVRVIFASFGMLFSGAAKVSDMSGPVGITAAISNVAAKSLLQAWYFIAFISINLGIMNILPLPALDGGRLVFILYEAIRGKPVNQKYEGFVHIAGFVLFIGLFLFVTFNDILRIIS